VPAIGPDGFVFSRIDFTFLIIAFPIVVLVQWLLERWVMRRVIWKLVRREKPDRGQLGRHKVVLSESGVTESTGGQ
jgi:hypothetical protein